MTNFDMPQEGTWEQRGGWVVRQLMTQFGLTDAQAAGIVGNLGFESGGLTKLHEIGQLEGVGGYGWGQWTAARRVAFFAWCTQHSLDWQSDEANYGYLCAELHGPQAFTITRLKGTNSVETAVFSVGQTYERPGGTTATHLPGYDGRLVYARRALAGAQSAVLTSDLAGTAVDVPQATGGLQLAPLDALKRIQEVLRDAGTYKADIDGAFGRQSRAALNELLRLAAQPGI